MTNPIIERAANPLSNCGITAKQMQAAIRVGNIRKIRWQAMIDAALGEE